MCHICCYGCVRKNILRKHIITKHGADALPPDMVFKRGYPLLEGVEPEQEEETRLASQGQEEQQQPITIQHQQIKEQKALRGQHQQPIIVQHPQVVTEQPVVMEAAQQQQAVHITNSTIVTTSAEAPFNSAALRVTVNHQGNLDATGTLNTPGSHETTQPVVVAELNRPQSGETAQPIVAMQNVTSPSGQTSLDNTINPHPPVANQMAGHLYSMIRHSSQQEQTLPVSTQSGESLQAAASHQPMAPLFSHSQQPIGNQPGYPEYPGYLSNSQISLIQQMYLQTYNASNNMPQQQ